jgi:Fe-S cluster biogenesis protein NfuA
MNATDQNFLGRIGRIETLIEEIERFADPATRARAREIVQALLEFHGAALSNVVSIITRTGVPGRNILEEVVRDDLAANLLLLHDLHPHDLASRVSQALDRVRPQLHGHGGDVELLGVEDGIVRLRMRGSCHGCPSSSASLRQTIETAILDAAPDVAAIEVEGVVEPPPLSLLPIVTIGTHSPTRIGGA